MYKILIILFFSSLSAQYVNNETGWEFYQSPFQSFFIFEDLQIDGQVPAGDGWAPSLTQESECINNPNTCDVIGAFLNDVCIGWVYADSEGGTTLPLMGYDDTNSETQINTFGYAEPGDVPELKFYDSSTGFILDLSTSNDLPSWSLNFAHIIYNISFANNGILAPNVGWSYFQTSQQAFYLFENILIDTLIVEPLDIVGAFKNDICVGWSFFNPDGFTTLPVMGSELDGYYSDYMYEGEVPQFKIFDFSENTIYDLVASDDVLSWENNLNQLFYGDSYAYVEQLIQEIDLYSGWNIFSLNVSPSVQVLFDILGPIHGSLSQVLDEGGAAIFPSDDGFADNIGLWQSTEGYLIKVLNDISLPISNDGILELPLDIPLTSGWNIISYPAQASNDIESVLASLLATNNLQLVFNEGGNVYIPDYVTGGDAVNSIISLSPDEGYYVKVDNNATLTISEPAFVFEEDLIVEESSSRDNHFIPVWSGNPFQPMTIIMSNAQWDGAGLQANDEIGVFDGSVCVGSYVVPDGGFPANSNVEIATSKDDGSGNGYSEGNTVSFRVWRDSQDADIDADINIFTDPSGNAINAVFVALSAPSAQIEVKSPSVPRNFTATGQTNQVNLTWNRPSVGDYKVYNYPDPGSSNAVTFNILRDNQLIAENFDGTVFVDTGLDNNVEYDYDIVSVSVVNTSSLVEEDALTKPGTPILSLSGGDNQIALTWNDPSVTGSDGSIDYQIGRQWIVGDQTYAESITSLDDDAYDQNYVDTGLLNSTAYSYRVRAHNASGYSGWTSYQEESTNLPVGNIAMVAGITDTTYQTVFPPSNVISLFWDVNNDAVNYSVYKKNILQLIVSEESFTDPYNEFYNLETSTTYQYVITAIGQNGQESLPSELIEVTTLPEYIPEAPDSLSLISGQNNINLSWQSVLGYGDPIGGAATSYNIYRFNIDGFDLDSIDTDDIIGIVSGTNTTIYTDSGLDDNIYYCYGVSGVNSENAEGSLSNIACEITQDQLAATTPQNLNASGGNQQIVLSWSASQGSPAIRYQIYRTGAGYADEFVADITATSYTDTGLAKNTEYTYYVVAWNELGPSNPSTAVTVSTTGQSHVLAGKVPEDLTATLDDNARASNYIDGYAQLNWDAKEFVDHPFVLAYTGNPYNPHTIIVENITFEDPSLQIAAGDVVAVFDNSQNCVGFGEWPLPNGQMSASKDDGSGNGFTDGSAAYFEVWDQSTGHVHTALESPSFTLTGLGLNYVDLDIDYSQYTIYRNGEAIVSGLTSESYQDNELEGEMDYEYAVAVENILGSWSLSNASQTVSVNTDAYIQSAPVLSEILDVVIDEDTSITIDLSATDADGDEITYFAEPVDATSPVNCVVDGSSLTLTPAQDHYGSFDIQVTAYDDTNFYEVNTLKDQIVFSLEVQPVNDNPLILNNFTDIYLLESEYLDTLFIELEDVFKDVDISIMNEDPLDYSLDLSSSDYIEAQISNNLLQLIIQNAGSTVIQVSASDQIGEAVSSSFELVIDQVLSVDNFSWPKEFSISDAYPNPFNPQTNFEIYIPEFSSVKIQVFDIRGKVVDKLFDGSLAKGVYQMQWDAGSFTSGVYFVSLYSNNTLSTKKVILLK